jgi:hypothetical protein
MPRRPARFRVYGGPFGKPSERTATMTVTEAMVSVRRRFGRRTYDLPADVVAKMVIERVTRAEVFKARMEKAKERKDRRRTR